MFDTETEPLTKKEMKKEIKEYKKNLKRELKESKKRDKENLKQAKIDMRLEKIEAKEARKRNKEISKNVSKSIKDIYNNIGITDEGAIITKTGYMNIFQVTGKDINAFSASESTMHIEEFIKFLQIYEDDIKVMIMNFPVNTNIQKNNVMRKLKQTDNEIFKKILNQKLQELADLEINRSNREFYIEVFSKTKQEEIEKRLNITRYNSRLFLINELAFDKKMQILFKLNNQNTKL
jgi:hypothetical protein